MPITHSQIQHSTLPPYPSTPSHECSGFNHHSTYKPKNRPVGIFQEPPYPCSPSPRSGRSYPPRSVGQLPSRSSLGMDAFLSPAHFYDSNRIYNPNSGGLHSRQNPTTPYKRTSGRHQSQNTYEGQQDLTSVYPTARWDNTRKGSGKTVNQALQQLREAGQEYSLRTGRLPPQLQTQFFDEADLRDSLKNTAAVIRQENLEPDRTRSARRKFQAWEKWQIMNGKVVSPWSLDDFRVGMVRTG